MDRCRPGSRRLRASGRCLAPWSRGGHVAVTWRQVEELLARIGCNDLPLAFAEVPSLPPCPPAPLPPCPPAPRDVNAQQGWEQYHCGGSRSRRLLCAAGPE